ncbi:hypothetical protein MN608_07138 [Microdochium nivale]|nr:hypothetical protein MN608_07138 [Microdochium nivale]
MISQLRGMIAIWTPCNHHVDYKRVYLWKKKKDCCIHLKGQIISMALANCFYLFPLTLLSRGHTQLSAYSQLPSYFPFANQNNDTNDKKKFLSVQDRLDTVLGTVPHWRDCTKTYCRQTRLVRKSFREI